MFIMRPTNGWDDRARTAPVPEIHHAHKVMNKNSDKIENKEM